MTWAIERRLDWIDDRLTDGETFRRADVVAYFGVTLAQVSLDVATFAKLDPALVYDRRAKLFRRVGGGSVRGSTWERRQAWQAFHSAPVDKSNESR